MPGSLVQVNEILTIDPAEIVAADEPGHVYLVCYKALQATNDPRAKHVLQQGYEMVQELATKISDEGLRRSFLENVPYNRDLIAAWIILSDSGV